MQLAEHGTYINESWRKWWHPELSKFISILCLTVIKISYIVQWTSSIWTPCSLRIKIQYKYYEKGPYEYDLKLYTHCSLTYSLIYSLTYISTIVRPPKVEFLLYVKQFLKDISGMVTLREKLKSSESEVLTPISFNLGSR